MSNQIEKSSDLYFSAYLMSVGCSFMKAERSSKQAGKVIFQFDASTSASFDLEGLRAAWMNGTGTCNARTYSECIIRLKRLVHSELE